jgi:hypothetical protein
MSSVPQQHATSSIDLHEGSAPPSDRGWLIGLAFVGFTIVIAALFVLYVLAWDGGAHT